jgi:hypothetical protein
MKPQHIHLTVLIIFLLVGCKTRYAAKANSSIELMESTYKSISLSAKGFEGQQKSVLLRAWGPPKSISSDGLGGEIYQYNNSVKLSTGIFFIYINMFIDKDGKIYSSDVKRLFQSN